MKNYIFLKIKFLSKIFLLKILITEYVNICNFGIQILIRNSKFNLENVIKFSNLP